MAVESVFVLALIIQAASSLSFNCAKNYFEGIGLITEEFGNKTFTGDISQLHHENFLKITDANVPILCEDAISGLPNLEKLYLNKLNIMAVKPGAFKDLPKLKELRLKENELQLIEAGIFNNLTLEVLDLSWNMIWVIEDAAFHNMESLKTIDVSHNNLKRIKKVWFTGCSSLHHLHFSHNSVRLVQKKIFKHIQPHEDLIVDISNNEIEKMQPRAFLNLGENGKINLSNNALRKLPDIFGGDTNRTIELILENNDFRCFETKILTKVFGKCNWVRLLGNPITCRCSTKLVNFSLSRKDVRVTYEIDPWCDEEET